VVRRAAGAAVSRRLDCRNAVATIPALAFYTRTDIIMSEKRKLLYWEGSSKKDFKEFPVPVQKDMGVSLFVVQLGGTPDSAKPWKGLGSGVYELVEDHRGDTFRAIYTVKIGDAVHVLHAFQKKSKSGIATPQPDVELIEKRLKAVLARYAASGRR
jgi:phage-related protein